MFIYTITNTKNGKVYVGQTIHKVEKRLKHHQNSLRRGDHVNRYLQHAYNIDGDHFIYEAVASARHIEELNELEIFYISLYQSLYNEHGYNLRLGGKNSQHSEETKKKMSQKRTGKYRDPSHNEKIANTLRGRKRPPEVVLKMKNKTISQEMRDRISKTLTGRKPSPEAIENMRIAREKRKGIPVSIETREKLSRANKGKVMSAESRRKMSEAAKNRKKKADP